MSIRNKEDSPIKIPDSKRIIKECYSFILINSKYDMSLVINNMDKFLERHKLPKFTLVEIDNPNSPISTKEIEFTV